MADVDGVEMFVVGLTLNKDLDSEREKKSHQRLINHANKAHCELKTASPHYVMNTSSIMQ